ncbi:hypothetical protein [Pseudoclavibacter endophyticus]|nr:hypothetical protein [Pseudoclavibacter endophyticus]
MAEPPADVSNAVPRRPGPGWALQGDDAGLDDVDDFFSSYRRKGPSGQTSQVADDDDVVFPTRRSRRRFQPDLGYESAPLPAAPQPEAPRPAVPGASDTEPPRYRDEIDDEREGIDDPAPEPKPAYDPSLPAFDPELDLTRPAPIMYEAKQPEPVAAPQADEAQVPHWFEELDQPEDASPERDAPAAPVPRSPRAEAAPARPQPPQWPAQPEQDGAGAEGRDFEEVLSGGEPGTETSDQPIVARDFERTGIVHVPRLDDGRTPAPTGEADVERGSQPASQRPAGDEAWQAPRTGQGPAVAPLPEQRGGDASRGAAPSPFQPPADAQQRGDSATPHQPDRPTSPADAPQPGPSQAREAAGREDPREIFADWFGEDTHVDDEPTIAVTRTPAGRGPQDTHSGPSGRPPAEAYDASDPGTVERQRPWYEQGLDGTETSEQAPPFGAAARASAAAAAGVAGAAAGPRAQGAPTSAPTYRQPPSGGHAPRGHDARGGAPVDARGAGGGPAGPRGPGNRGRDGSGSGDGGGVRGAVAGLDPTKRRRLLTIAIAAFGAVLLVVSAVIIGNALGARDGDDQAAPTESAAATDDAESPSGDPTEAAPPPPVADPSFEPVAFQSESGNLRCIITPEFGVACQHSDPAFPIPPEVCTTTGQSGAVIGLDSNGYTYPCLEQDIPYGQETLPMGQPIHAGEFACSITLETGVSCFNAAGDIIGLEFQLGIGLVGNPSSSPQPTIALPDVAL